MKFVQILGDAFDLCRDYRILEEVPHGRPCAYFDMGKCPAPCNGSISLDRYRGMMTEAMIFAAGDRKTMFDEWDRWMREAAGQRDYERACAFRQRIERARGIEHRAFRHASLMDDFNYLVVQRGGGTTRVKPFFIRKGKIRPGNVIKMAEVDKNTADWIEEARGLATVAQASESSSSCVDPSSQELAEQVWLVSHFLFKRDAPGLFLSVPELNDPRLLAERIRDRFSAQNTIQPQE